MYYLKATRNEVTQVFTRGRRRTSFIKQMPRKSKRENGYFKTPESRLFNIPVAFIAYVRDKRANLEFLNAWRVRLLLKKYERPVEL